jgi:ABC-type branched-subunit amino acid transport system substrate-binding protein
MDGPRLLVGKLHDYPTADGGAAFEWAVRRAFAEVEATGRLPGPLEIVHETAFGLPLPGGSARSVEDAFHRLDAEGVLAVLGPAISDNAIVVRPLADAAGIPTLNYSGADESRSALGFHFQIGSLEDEPSFLAAHLVARGFRRIALVHDTSYIGRRMADYFQDACAAYGLALVARVSAPTTSPDAADPVAVARSTEPDALVTLGLWDLPRAVSLELAATGWSVPTTANSALIYGHAQPEWARGWEGWTYIDTVDDDNPRYAALVAAARDAGHSAGPGAAGAYDMGRLLAEAIARAPGVTRDAIAIGFERVRALPSATGRPDTLMGFGRYDRGALKGQYLVVRQWRDGTSQPW